MNLDNNQIAEIIVETTDNLIKNKLNKLKFDETIEATIVSQSEDNSNKYLVQYNDLKFYASTNSAISYNAGTRVYVLVPQGDWGLDKVIIGVVSQAQNKQLKRVFTNTLDDMAISKQLINGNSLNYIPEYDCLGLQISLSSTNKINNFAIGLKLQFYKEDQTIIAASYDMGSVFTNNDIIGYTGYCNPAFKYTKTLTISSELIQILKENQKNKIKLIFSIDVKDQDKNNSELIIDNSTAVFIGYNKLNMNADNLMVFPNSIKYIIDPEDDTQTIPDIVYFELYDNNSNNIINHTKTNANNKIYAYKYAIGATGTALSGPYWIPVDYNGNEIDNEIPFTTAIFNSNCSLLEQETIYKFIWIGLDENKKEIKKGEKSITYLNPNKIEIDIPNFSSTQPLRLSLADGDTGIYNVYGMDGKITGSQDQEIHTVSVSLYSEGENDTDTKLVPENISSIFWTYPESIYNDGTFVLPKSGIIEEYEYNADDQTYASTNIKFWQSGDDWLEGRPLQFKYKLNSQCYDSYTNNTISCIIVMNDGNRYTGNITLEFGGYRSQGTPYSLNIDIIGEQKFIAPSENTSIQLKATFERIDGKNLDVSPTYSWSMITNDKAPHTLEAEGETATLTIVDSGWHNGLVIQVDVEYVIENLSQPIVFTEYLPIAYSLNSSQRCVGPNRIVYDMYGDISYDKTPYNLYMDNTFSNIIADLEWSISNFVPDVLSHKLKTSKVKDENGNDIEKITNELLPEAFSLVNSEAIFDLVIAKKNGITYWCQPIVTVHNCWNDEQLNNWTGKTITGDDGILTPYVAAGTKDDNNTFTGVMLGAAADVWGLYGYSGGIPRFYFTEEGEAYIGNPDENQYIQLTNKDGLSIQTKLFNLEAGGNKIIADGEKLSLRFQDNFTVTDQNNHGISLQNGLFTISTASLDLRVDDDNRITMDQDSLELHFTNHFEINDQRGNWIKLADDGMTLSFTHEFTLSNSIGSSCLTVIDDQLALRSSMFELQAGHSYIGSRRDAIGDANVYPELRNDVNVIINGSILAEYTGELEYCSIPTDGIDTIADFAFFQDTGNTKLRGIQLHENIAQIGEYAFARCTNVRSLSLPSSIEHLGEGICEYMFELKYIAFGESGSINTTSVPAFMCQYCNRLDVIVLGSGIETVEEKAFYAPDRTISPIKIWIPKTFKVFDTSAFESTAQLEVYFEGDENDLQATGKLQAQKRGLPWFQGQEWHYNCSIEEFKSNIVQANTYAEDIELNLVNGYFYDGDFHTTSYLRFKDGDLDIKTEKLNIELEDNCIKAEDGILSMYFTKGFEFGDGAANSIKTENGYLSIASQLFDLSAGKSYLKVSRDNEPWTVSYPECRDVQYEIDDSVDYDIPTLIQVDQVDIQEQYGNTFAIPEHWGVESLAEGLFDATENQEGSWVVGIHFPSSLKNIGEYCFYEQKLQRLFIPSNIKTIGPGAFEYNYDLTLVDIADNSVDTIPSDCFEGCGNLSVVIIGYGVKTIADGAFANIAGRANISIPASVTHINSNAFNHQRCEYHIYYGGSEGKWQTLMLQSGISLSDEVTVEYNSQLQHTFAENVELNLTNSLLDYSSDDVDDNTETSYIKFIDGEVSIKTQSLDLSCGNSYILSDGSNISMVLSNDNDSAYIKFEGSDLSIKSNSFDLQSDLIRFTNDTNNMIVKRWVVNDKGETVLQDYEFYSHGLTLLDGDGTLCLKLGHVNNLDYTYNDTQYSSPIYGLNIYNGAFRIYGDNLDKPKLWMDQNKLYISGYLTNADEYDVSTSLALGPIPGREEGAGLHLWVDINNSQYPVMTIAPRIFASNGVYGSAIEFNEVCLISIAQSDFDQVKIVDSGGELNGLWSGCFSQLNLQHVDYISSDEYQGTIYIIDNTSSSGYYEMNISSSGNPLWVYNGGTQIGLTNNLCLYVGYQNVFGATLLQTQSGTEVGTMYINNYNWKSGTNFIVDGVLLGGTCYQTGIKNSDYPNGITLGHHGLGICTTRIMSVYEGSPDNHKVYYASKASSPTQYYAYGLLNIIPSTGGTPGGRLYGTWYLDSSTAITSDIKQKHNINALGEQYSLLFDKLQPCTFQYKNGDSSRLHTGFIAQDVEQAISDANLSTQEFAGLVIEPTNEYFLRYEEFIALNTWEIQKLKARVIELENQITVLQKQINS